MVTSGVIEDYVIGGATALLYYSQPMFTEDIDIFISLKSDSQLIINLEPVYRFLQDKYNAKQEKEYLIIDDIPLQFLVPYDTLSEEAFLNCNSVIWKDVSFKIFNLEYIMGIMIQLNKPKYRERLSILLRDNNYNADKLEQILKKHDLYDKWLEMKGNLI